MTLPSNHEPDKQQLDIDRSFNIDPDNESKTEKILCPHCQRTATNGIKCKGICVADSDY